MVIKADILLFRVHVSFNNYKDEPTYNVYLGWDHENITWRTWQLFMHTINEYNISPSV